MTIDAKNNIHHVLKLGLVLGQLIEWNKNILDYTLSIVSSEENFVRRSVFKVKFYSAIK